MVTADVPAPIDCEAVVLLRFVLLVPHSNHAFAESPFGFTLPLIVAPVAEIEEAAAVITVGAPPAWVTVKVWPAIVIVPLRCAAPLAATL
jgi:hypothetical protein